MNIKIENKDSTIDSIFDMHLSNNKEYNAVFNDDLACVVVFNKYGLFKKKDRFQIRFSDNLNKEKKVEIRNLLINKYGEPLYYAADRGFVWRADNYYISYGYYEINYHYAVLMIIIQKDFLNIEKMKYDNYKKVFDVFNKHDLVDDIILPWTRYSGFILYKKYPRASLLITYKKKHLIIYESKLEKIDDTANKLIPHSRKKKKVETIDKLDEELEKLNFNRFENL